MPKRVSQGEKKKRVEQMYEIEMKRELIYHKRTNTIPGDGKKKRKKKRKVMEKGNRKKV